MSLVSLMTDDKKVTLGNDPTNKIVLEVGFTGDTWKYSINRHALAEKSEWFRALLVGSMAPPISDPPPIIRLQHVDKRAFDHLFKYFCGEPIHFNSVLTARSTLDAAHYYICPELAKLAIDYIIKNLTPSTVLTVYHGLNLYLNHRSRISQETLAISNDDVTEIAVACSQLFNACLAVIDGAIDQVLCQENFEELTCEEVRLIASRDDLKLTQESILFKALEKWAASECRRCGVEPTPYNKRAALSDEVWYSVRYLLMNDREFIQGPMASGILTSEESAAIVAKILGHTEYQGNSKRSNNNFIDRKLLAVPRKNKISSKIKKNSMKLAKKEREDNKKNQKIEHASQSQQACARVGDFVIRALAYVFD
ncbi:BTB/POZ domain-containing protein 6-like [Chelonus insularis]|uniref:BTB/POZ domain-containing protein 6-like n=1 Tax=Chelonus insularis TaxID=460826 RepID=UPI00158C6284|nr:BTB/POZ domain-containing protein 6-like [Chelonus insularis]XP_034942717.1 BTB/POZ domain-containing protein 6-like [Chelonus insularis]XP_034942719.1 BTB/POZ domain-containing protein 6-like [Chelonus insularis]